MKPESSVSRARLRAQIEQAGTLTGPETAEALHESAERMRAILETAVEGIVTIDSQGIIESVNPAAERIFGYRVTELVGRNVSMLMPSPFREHHDRYVKSYVEGGVPKIIGIGREVVGLRKDGTTFPMDLSVSEVNLGHRRLFTGFIRDITERKRLEQEVSAVSEREQRRIGQDLHDGLCQQLAGIEFMCEVLSEKVARRSKADAVAVADIGKLVRDSISQTRDLARGLCPVVLESEGLMAALQALAGSTTRMFRVDCSFHCHVPVLVRDHSTATHLFRIAQEAVSNAIRHGRAKQIKISLTRTPGRLSLAVRDDGQGIGAVHPGHRGMGLRIMEYRAGVIGGSFAVQREPEGGTSVVCTVHLAESQPSAMEGTS